MTGRSLGLPSWPAWLHQCVPCQGETPSKQVRWAEPKDQYRGCPLNSTHCVLVCMQIFLTHTCAPTRSSTYTRRKREGRGEGEGEGQGGGEKGGGRGKGRGRLCSTVRDECGLVGILSSYVSEVAISSKKCTLRWLGTTFDAPFITVLNFKNHFPFFILNIFNSYTLNNEKGSPPAS